MADAEGTPQSIPEIIGSLERRLDESRNQSETPLTAARVEHLFGVCSIVPHDVDPHVIEAVSGTIVLDPGAVAKNRDEIRAMLGELDPLFHQGWSFLNMCEDKHGQQWTGLHQTVEKLCCLGIAAGLASWCMPRSMWALLPGSMPYIIITLED